MALMTSALGGSVVSKIKSVKYVASMVFIWHFFSAFTAWAEPVSHHINFSDAQHQYLEIETRFPASSGQTMAYMPVWTPGSYLIREFSRNVDSVQAFGDQGEGLNIKKTQKNRWLINTEQTKSVALKYRVYAAELSVRTSWVNSEYAVLNAGSMLLLPWKQPNVQHKLTLDLPDEWSGSGSALESIGENQFLAQNEAELIDSPIIAGQLEQNDFSVQGVSHSLMTVGDTRYWDNEKAVKDLQKLVKTHSQFWGGVPYPHYVFLNVLSEGRGGLEHKNSTVIMASRWAMNKRELYKNWLELASHEFFHTWNIKRMRPKSLLSYQMENENYTEALWFVEGFTSYYQSVLNRRAGIIDEKEFYGQLARRLQKLYETPGRLEQSMVHASFDAWIKFYRPDANSLNSRISYYTKGAVIALLLDARLRQSGQYNLDQFMQAAWQAFQADGYTNQDLIDLLEKLAGPKHAKWLKRAIETREELDWSILESTYGLKLKHENEPVDSEKKRQDLPAWIRMKTQDDRLLLKSVVKNSALWHAGLNAGDEILAIDDYYVQHHNWKKRLENYRPGEVVTLLYARKDKLHEVVMTLESKPLKTWELSVSEQTSKKQNYRRKQWLN